MNYEKNDSLTSFDLINFESNVTATDLNRGITHQIDKLFNSDVKVKELKCQIARMNASDNQVVEKSRPLRRPSRGLPHQVKVIVVKE